jgi:hypothetical protein
MAIILANGDPGDGSLVAGSWKHEGGVVNANPDFQADARGGQDVAIENLGEPLSGQTIVIGGEMWNGATQANRREGFIAFRPNGGLVVPVGIGEVELVNAAVRHGRNTYAHAGAPYPDDSIRWYIRDWSSPMTTSAWVSLNGLQGDNTPDFETKNWIQDRADDLSEVSARRMYADALDKLSSGGSLSYMITLTSATTDYPSANNTYQGYIPTANNTNKPLYFRPTAVLRYVRRHALNHVLGASIQLKDGTAVFLRYSHTTERASLYYQKVNETVPTLIANLKSKSPGFDNSSGATQWFGIEPGNQTFSITRDDANNIYVVGSRGNEQTDEYNTQFYNVQGFRYLGNYSWQEYTHSTSGDSSSLITTDVHRGQPNCFAAVWLPSSQGGPRGQICTMHSRRDAQWSKYQMGIASEYAGWYFADAGALRQHGMGFAGGVAPPVATWWRPWNSSGTGMDAFRDGNTIRWASFIQATPTGPDERSGLGSVTVAASGAVPDLTPVATSISVNSPHDPDAKVRAIWLGDNSPYYGIARHGHIELHNKSNDAVYRQIDLTGFGFQGFPSRADLQKSAAWDCIWVNGTNKIAVYYKDTNNARKIRRLFWDFVDGGNADSEEFTTTPVGTSGDDIIAIRLPRQQTDSRCILLDVAMQDGSGAPTGIVTIRDTSLDVPPSAPTIVPIDQFNAGGTKAIEWIFNDANALDFATFQDVEIRNLTTGVTAHFVNHVAAVVVDAAARKYRYTVGASVLTNDTNYQVRVRAYDSVDVVGDWSAWTNFATTATGGIVTVTEPATDLEPLNRSSVTIKWTYGNSTPSTVQTGYRVRVYNDDTGVIFSDSGAVNSTTTEYTITSLISDVRYRVEVTITDSTAQTSGAGARLIFPDFNNPSVPQVELSAEQGYIEIRVTNPPPTGDNPVTTKNQIARKETGQDDTAYVVIGECPPNGVFSDYTVASGVSYTYKARGQS